MNQVAISAVPVMSDAYMGKIFFYICSFIFI